MKAAYDVGFYSNSNRFLLFIAELQLTLINLLKSKAIKVAQPILEQSAR